MTELSIPIPFVTGGSIANYYAAQSVFGDYLHRLAPRSLAAIHYDLISWCKFLYDGHMIADPDCAEKFMTDPESWDGVTWGQVRSFQEWLIKMGMAYTTINRRISTVRTFCRLAAQAGTLNADDLRMIETVHAISRKAARNLNEHRSIPRVGTKKASSILISDAHAALLKTCHNSSAQGTKDRLLMCILIDLGLRSGEVVTLRYADVDISERILRIYRHKTDQAQTLRITRDLYAALQAYFCMWSGSPETKLLDHSTRSLTKRVRSLGMGYGYQKLSAHDMRHYLATKLAREGLNAHLLMEAMGWASITTAQRYIESSAIANGAAAAIIDK